MTIYGTGGVELVLGLSCVGLFGLVRTLMPPWSTVADEDFYFSSDTNNNKYNAKLLHELAIDTRVLRKKNENDAKLISSTYNNSSCSICIHDFEAGDEVSVVIACHHAFHSECLKMWIPKSATCPYCRQDLEIVRQNEEETSDIRTGEGRKVGAWGIFEGVFGSIYDYAS